MNVYFIWRLPVYGIEMRTFAEIVDTKLRKSPQIFRAKTENGAAENGAGA
jgi:hypothetical protein